MHLTFLTCIPKGWSRISALFLAKLKKQTKIKQVLVLSDFRWADEKFITSHGEHVAAIQTYTRVHRLPFVFLNKRRNRRVVLVNSGLMGNLSSRDIPFLAPGGASYIKFNESFSLLSVLTNSLEEENRESISCHSMRSDPFFRGESQNTCCCRVPVPFRTELSAPPDVFFSSSVRCSAIQTFHQK